MPTFIPVEYDPFAPVPVEHDPWEGHPDPFAYQPVADKRRQAYEAWQAQATQGERRDDAASFYDNVTLPGTPEGEVMPPTEAQRRSMAELRYEHDATQGQQPRDRALSDAMHSDQGRYLRLPEEYGHALMYDAPGQRISDRQLVDEYGNVVFDEKPQAVPTRSQRQKSFDEAKDYFEITRQLDAQSEYNSNRTQGPGERARLAQEYFASKFPSWEGLFDPRPMVDALGRTLDPRPLAGAIGSGLSRMHDTVFPPAY